MHYNQLGKTQIKISKVGLGTWAIGGGPWWGQSDVNESIRGIEVSIDQGINLIDTAPGYGFGCSEEVIGKAIKGKRQHVILSTKCGLWWEDERSNFAFELEGKKVYKSLKPETICKELESSLKRLGTDYIDIYHTHWPDITTPIAETAICLDKLVQEGKIRSIAASNINLEQCKEYLKYCELSAIQMKYSILDRKQIEELVPFCFENNISILGYSPLEQGLLTGKIGMERTFSPEEYRNSIPWYQPRNRKRVLDMLKQFECIAEKYNCSLGQLVIAYTGETKGITSLLCGARSQKHAIENAVSGNVKLDVTDITYMNRIVQQLGEPQ